MALRGAVSCQCSVPRAVHAAVGRERLVNGTSLGPLAEPVRVVGQVLELGEGRTRDIIHAVEQNLQQQMHTSLVQGG